MSLRPSELCYVHAENSADSYILGAASARRGREDVSNDMKD